MKPFTLVGCGILGKEVEALVSKNGWPIQCYFSCSSLHVNFHALRDNLEKSLRLHRDENPKVFYGACHPLMDTILESHHTIRTRGQNCIEMLLGANMFQKELAAGAFFLLEDWAHSWKKVISRGIGSDPGLWKEIFCSQHKYVLALRTPCSDDFSDRAETFSLAVGLPLQWADTDLTHLEAALRDLIHSAEENENG
ncbi:MAG: hypothetical protein CVV64_16745 [Candidatus Wallbacteria bacterium HGW-Wallbacteria-1]|jgi:hypothetical protein|uniref:DUF1638 domain-containing protein n=1 Tax=Candidatus Wallbacteria bacterium HGW-Wallbacteria-1 TaxID=2013854 RepID=A0A2N1PKU0_9BACT|nr:MAG: hypothetical protein CVV64_16745 [Candidatus Wallbacteria bacterium HGW-Wallbacteria-1]